MSVAGHPWSRPGERDGFSSARLGPLVAPTAEQRLLLRAALQQDAPQREAWEAWQRRTVLEQLDLGSQRLLPQLYRTLGAARTEADDPALARLKGVYRHAWSANAVLLRETRRALEALAQHGISAVVHDGAAFVTLYYRDQGARPIESIALMVPPDLLQDAVQVLRRIGWAATEPSPDASAAHCRVRLAGPGRVLDLAWDPFPDGCSPETRLAAWRHARVVRMAGAPAAMLAPGDELLRTCVLAARWEEAPPFRRLADAAVLLHAAGAAVDWERFLVEAARSRLVLPVRASLALIREVLDAPVPDEVLTRLAAAPAGLIDRLEQRMRQQPWPRLGRLPALVFRWRRLDRKSGPSLAEYLQAAWGVRHAWQLPFAAAGRGVRRLVGPR